ncbi:hypothetical protein [Schleiferilactobacillus shenzhenensis]|nr:hypothetical protein [Schleiferilactobacillus shenzhenensis]
MDDISGEIFHSFRVTDRKLSVAQVANGIMNQSSLRRFEKGDTSPYWVTVLPLLERLRIAPSEFFARTEGFGQTDTAAFYSRVTHAYNRKDTVLLDQMLATRRVPNPQESATLPFDHVDRITIQAAIAMLQGATLPKEETEFIVSYLHSQRTWFFYDLNMLRFIPGLLPHDDLVWLAQNLFSHASAYINVLNNADLTADTVLNIATSLITVSQDYDEAERLLASSRREDALKGKLDFSVHRKTLEAALVFHRGDLATAMNLYRRILDALDLFDADWDAQQVTTMWPLLIGKREEP